jgi:hypothetical protein
MEELLDHYVAAFDRLDAEQIAGLYRMPCAIADADGVQTFTEHEMLVRKFSQNCLQLQQLGYQRAQYQLLSVEPLGDNQLLVNVAWRVVFADSQLDFRSMYIVHKLEQRWLIFSTHVYPGSFASGQ